jgi:hypothetical protein
MMTAFWILMGIGGAIAFLVFARNKPQEAQVLAVGLVVAVLIYVGFALTGRINQAWIAIEVTGVVAYNLVAGFGLRYSKRWLMLGWLAHPLWDVGIHLIGQGRDFRSSVYVLDCVSFDLLVAAYIATAQLGMLNLRKSNYET